MSPTKDSGYEACTTSRACSPRTSATPSMRGTASTSREYDARTGRPWLTATEMVLEQFGTANRRPEEGAERDPDTD